jgi:NADH-quinone oxidoreductase subunit J
MVVTFFFYLFALLAIASAMMVILSRNPVHSVLFLILCFFNAAGLFILMGAEFLAMILVVGYLPIGGVIGLIVFAELALVAGTWSLAPDAIKTVSPTPTNITNTQAIGEILYTKYVYFFEAAGLVLLVAMIGAIVLTLRHKPGIKRQNIADQVARTPATAMEIRKVEPGQGI